MMTPERFRPRLGGGSIHNSFADLFLLQNPGARG